MNAYYSFFLIGAFFISISVNKFLLIYLKKRGVLDIPNERSSHKTPTPRGGGIGIMLGVFLTALIYCVLIHNWHLLLIIGVSVIIGIVGLIDDLKQGLHTGLRFGIQLACSLLIIWVFDPIDKLPLPHPLNIHLHFFGFVVSLIWLIGITNIFNFLDGIDGYAGTQGFIGGLMLALLSWGSPLAIIALIIAAANAGFLLYNWHPAKIFMGDVGSSFLGFLFASLPFYIPNSQFSDERSQVFFAMAIILWFFLLDGTFTIFRRLINREKIWQAHRSHLYQRLNKTGMSHSQVVISICFLYLVLYLITIFYAVQPDTSIIQWTVLIVGFLLFVLLLLYTLFREKRLSNTGSVKKK